MAVKLDTDNATGITTTALTAATANLSVSTTAYLNVATEATETAVNANPAKAKESATTAEDPAANCRTALPRNTATDVYKKSTANAMLKKTAAQSETAVKIKLPTHAETIATAIIPANEAFDSYTQQISPLKASIQTNSLMKFFLQQL